MNNFSSQKHIGIVGCGWLGLALGAKLAAQGWRVEGSTTTEAKLPVLAQAGIVPHLLRLAPEPVGNWAAMLAAPLLLVCTPPQRAAHGDAFYVEQMQHLAALLAHSAARRVLMVSSTSVYPETGRDMRETDEVDADNPIVQAERHLLGLADTGREVVVLRCGGLMGYNRIPGRYVAGKVVDSGQVPVNFVHRDDVLAAVELAAVHPAAANEVFNVVAPLHPVRAQVYLQSAQQCGFAPPVLVDNGPKPYKTVNSEKLVSRLGFGFRYPDPLGFAYQC